MTTPIRVRSGKSLEFIESGLENARIKTEKHEYDSAIEIISQCIFTSEPLKHGRQGEYNKLLSKAYEILGDIYVATQYHDAALGCFVTGYALSNSTALRKALYISKVFYNKLSSDSLLLGFALGLSSEIDYPGKRHNTDHFLETVQSLSSRMSNDLELFVDLYIMREPVASLNVLENLSRQEELFDAVVSKYGDKLVEKSLDALSSRVLTSEIKDDIGLRIKALHDKVLYSGYLSSINREIGEKKFQKEDGEEVPRLRCEGDDFWRGTSARALYEHLKRNINFAFSYDALIDSFFGHPAIIREIKRRVGLYTDDYLPLDHERFDKIFLHPLNIESARSIYRRIPVL